MVHTGMMQELLTTQNCICLASNWFEGIAKGCHNILGRKAELLKLQRKWLHGFGNFQDLSGAKNILSKHAAFTYECERLERFLSYNKDIRWY